VRLSHLLEATKSWQSIADEIAAWARRYFGFGGWDGQRAITDLPPERMPKSIEINGLHLSRIGKGSSRRAYRIDGTNVVAKIGSYSLNRAEYRYYLKATEQQRRSLARPMALSKNGLVLLMQYVPNAARRSDVGALSKTHPRRHDLWSGNIKRSAAGQPKLIDYAE
jgi:hypothetical protein